MSVLRYPGGKTRAVKILARYVPTCVDSVCSPFVGGASFELYCAQTLKRRVYAYDLYEPLINFWSCLKDEGETLSAHIADKMHPMDKQKFHDTREWMLKAAPTVSTLMFTSSESHVPTTDVNVSQTPTFVHLCSDIAAETKCEQVSESKSKIERAAAFFSINRCSYSGTTCSGGFSNESSNKRFTKSAIERMRSSDLTNVSFAHRPFYESIVLHEHEIRNGKTFLFMDPPYYLEKKSNLYGTEGDLHKNFPHAQLAEVCKRLCVANCTDTKDGESKESQESTTGCHSLWLLCYNNCDHVRHLYADFKIVEADWSYGMSSNKTQKSLPKEILILSPALAAILSVSSQPETVAPMEQRKRKPRSQQSVARSKRQRKESSREKNIIDQIDPARTSSHVHCPSKATTDFVALPSVAECSAKSTSA